MGAEQPGLGILPGPGDVLHVYRSVGEPEISDAVVSGIPVDVIYLATWPLVMHIKPRKPVTVVTNSTNPDLPVANRIEASSDLPYLSSLA